MTIPSQPVAKKQLASKTLPLIFSFSGHAQFTEVCKSWYIAAAIGCTYLVNGHSPNQRIVFSIPRDALRLPNIPLDPLSKANEILKSIKKQINSLTSRNCWVRDMISEGPLDVSGAANATDQLLYLDVALTKMGKKELMAMSGEDETRITSEHRKQLREVLMDRNLLIFCKAIPKLFDHIKIANIDELSFEIITTKAQELKTTLHNPKIDLSTITEVCLSDKNNLLTQLPTEILLFKGLTSLDLSLCSNLVSLPEFLKDLTALTSLTLSNLYNLRTPALLDSLPESLKDQVKIQFS